MIDPVVFALSFHAGYRCGRSGACCTAGWAIPVEAPRRAILGGALLVPDASGACRFFDRASGLCSVQRDRGEPMMPDACRHFPRLALADDRGTHVTLSHFCPTAAGLLFRDDRPVAIVASPPAFPPGDYDGLDARGDWAPLVHASLLFDYAAYAAWERFMVAACAMSPDTTMALATIATAAERLRRWTPDDGAMEAFVARLAAAGETDVAALARYADVRSSARRIVLDAIPESLQESARQDATPRLAPPTSHQAPGGEPIRTPDRAAAASHRAPRTPHVAPAASHPGAETVIARYLAAKAFASWTAYQGRGVRTLVAELVLTDALVRDLVRERTLVEAIREADRLLVHLADRVPLLERLGRVERE